jgi:hypothetical protein
MNKPDDIVPISSLFFEGPGPHVVRAGFPPRNTNEANYTPARGQELRALLSASISQLGAVSGAVRRRTPHPLPPPVAIESLLYRGSAALDRALEVREEILAGGTPESSEKIEELLDLVALAATE